MRAVSLLALLLACTLLLGQCRAEGHHGRKLQEIVRDSIRNDPRSLIPLHQPFAFDGHGVIDIKVLEDEISVPEGVARPNRANLAVVGVPESRESHLETTLMAGECPLNGEDVWELFNFQSVTDHPEEGKEFHFHVDTPEGVIGRWTLYFVKCEPEATVSFDIEVQLYNMLPDGTRSYVSVGEDGVAFITMAFLCAYFAGLVSWVGLCIKQRSDTHKIHHLMTVLGVVKVLTLLTLAGMQFVLARTGHYEGWDIVYYFFNAVRALLFFVVIILIGAGWSYMKPFLADREKRIVMIVIPIQILCNIALIVTREEGPAARNWITWWDLLIILDVVSVVVILLPIVWSMRHLKEAAKADGKAARNYRKLELFRQFYIVVIAWIYFSRIIAFLLLQTLSFRYAWVADLFREGATLAFYIYVAMMFRPTRHNPYLSIEMADFVPPPDSDDEGDEEAPLNRGAGGDSAEAQGKGD
ncbi:unnamed protein product [Pedinophyceae sp. YPF-701]|nr:unnamed protein product [Pedinophyceae sp. YPF-701]